MTGKEFDKLFEDQVTECRAVMTTKGSDYTDNLDRLSNFKVVGAMIGVDPKIVWAVYVSKHYLAIMNYCGRGKVESEAIEGRFTDLINYAHLGHALVVEEKQTPEPHEYDLWLAEQPAAAYEVSEQCAQTSDNIPAFPTFVGGLTEVPDEPKPSFDDLYDTFKQANGYDTPPDPPTLNLWERLKQLASS